MVPWDSTCASRVCAACFGGDPVAMQRYAKTYLAGGHQAVPALGARFREIVRGRCRREFWELASRQLGEVLGGSGPSAAPATAAPPEWMRNSGGSHRWSEWATAQARRCRTRALKSARRRKSPAKPPGLAEFRRAILGAMSRSNGRAYFSHFPLSLAVSSGHPCHPSVEHLDGVESTNVVLETRMVNDMKSIMDEKEFIDLIGHMSSELKIAARKLDDSWRPARDFAGPAEIDEPPLPGAAAAE